tara:strand:- start:357 stop:551 length:195 start_codon:yes stop_codon:yes gene_type:complete
MPSRVLDDFIDDCFLSGDDICRFQIYRSRKYENRVNSIASQLIASNQKIGLMKTTENADKNSNF